MKKSIYFIVGASFIAIALITTPSCNKDKVGEPVPNECADTVSFAATIEPLIQQSCATSGCHNAATSASGYNLEGHANISTNAQIILTVIRHESGVVPMPYFQPKLSDSIIKQVGCWINQGALDN
jgi:mono/diheme cytochrome c family protein